jgi:hypothetical protein
MYILGILVYCVIKNYKNICSIHSELQLKTFKINIIYYNNMYVIIRH